MIVFLLGLLLISPLSAIDPLDILKEGNLEYIKADPLTQKQRNLLLKKQKPIATILTCSDSRVPPELIFNKNLGELFVVRIAGNTVDQLSLASLDYGVSYLETPLLVILGHQDCGAVSAAFSLGEENYGANIGTLLSQIQPSIHEVRSKYPNKSKKELLELAIEENVRHTHKEILYRSPEIRELVKEGTLQIREAVFHIDSGKVTWQ